MSAFRKVVMIPFNQHQQGGSVDAEAPALAENDSGESGPRKKPSGNVIRQRSLEKQRRLLRIIMHLAAVNGYNANDEIKLSNGKYMQGSDIVSLLTYALTPGRLVSGIKEFVELCHEAGVPETLIANESVKAMLARLNGKRPSEKRTSDTQTDEPARPTLNSADAQTDEPQRYTSAADTQTDDPPKRTTFSANTQTAATPRKTRSAQTDWITDPEIPPLLPPARTVPKRPQPTRTSITNPPVLGGPFERKRKHTDEDDLPPLLDGPFEPRRKIAKRPLPWDDSDSLDGDL